MIRTYSSMNQFLLHQAAETVRGRRGRSIGIIRGSGFPALFLDIGRRPERDGSLVIPCNCRAFAAAAITAAGLLTLIFVTANSLYYLSGRRR